MVFFCACHWPADMLLWMMCHCGILVKDVIVQLITTVSSQLSYSPAIGPTLGTRFSLLWGYCPLHRGSSGTGPMVVDREQNTITDVCNGIYSGSRYDPQ